MSDISYDILTGRLTPLGLEAFRKAFYHARTAGNRHVDLGHFLFHILSDDRSDISLVLDHFGIERGEALAEIGAALEALARNVTEMPSVGKPLRDSLDRGWRYATLLFGVGTIRTGHVLVGALRDEELRMVLHQMAAGFRRLDPDAVTDTARSVWAASAEETQERVAGPDAAGAGWRADAAADPDGSAAMRSPGTKGGSALSRFAIDMTAEAAKGGVDPVVGRDEEIRRVIDVLLRRRQNNPILTGEAGVGKTAVVEGFAQRIVAGDVPPQLKGVQLHALDIGLLQAGASMKGAFEERLRQVIDEVQASPVPIILFVDEAHTLIGAGGAKGTGDAANLLKPALARGTLRTIAATTWAEYREHFEKDPALTRRFQPVTVDEPSPERCLAMLRGLVEPMERHHGVRISHSAVAAAVTLSARYIPARQLPDKAVSLLDTAAARVAVSQTTTPAAIADKAAAIAAMETERAALLSERDLGGDPDERIVELNAALEKEREAKAALSAAHEREQTLVSEILALRTRVATDEDARAELSARHAELAALDPGARMIHTEVDADAVAAVVSDWTGIPVGRMLRDEVDTVLRLAEILKARVVGQDHGLETIARRIETSRAGLDDPVKPVGVFLLCGPSGVGKTETALALAEALYGGEQNIVTINMSEFQEAHTVSLLKGAPPGYVGYGEGGRLTEAVRRKPYSVVLLDEVEKAHPDVHELFFQVFDKGRMEDGTGRMIDFRNTLIILTSNVGTEAIMRLAEAGRTRPEPEVLDRALRPYLLEIFPPALLGRVVTIPYFPLSQEMLAGIVRLQLGRITARVKEAQKAALSVDPAVVDHIVARCTDPDSGGRMIDNIVTNTLLPDLSRRFLLRLLAGEAIVSAHVGIEDGGFTYEIV